ncbi:hypothetical protein QUA89_15535 [Microcoleus sp. F10-B4]
MVLLELSTHKNLGFASEKESSIEKVLLKWGEEVKRLNRISQHGYEWQL